MVSSTAESDLQAAWNGHAEVVKLLAQYGAPTASRDCVGATAVDYCVQRGHHQTLSGVPTQLLLIPVIYFAVKLQS